MTHPLLASLLAAAAGEFPPVDGGITWLPPLPDGNRAVVSFTGHAIVASPFTSKDVDDLEVDGFGAILHPQVLNRLGLGAHIGVLDVTLVAPGTGLGSDLPATTRWDGHPRVQHARELRRNVSVRGDERGLITVAEGLAGRREISIELADPAVDAGSAPELIAAARGLLEPSDWLFAAVSPGNARSLRSFLRCGFRPLGSELIFRLGDGR